MSEAFEEIVSVLLEADGYWVKRNVKINLSVEQKNRLGLKYGAFELDIIAIRLTNPSEVLVVECKNFTRSDGIDWKTFAPPVPPATRRHRYRLFWDAPLRNEITTLLQTSGITPPDLPHVFCLASAATLALDHPKIQAHLDSGGMRFFDKEWLLQHLSKLGASPVYMNNTVAALAALYHHPGNHRYA